MKRALFIFLWFAFPVRAQMSAPYNATVINLAGGETDLTNYLQIQAAACSGGAVKFALPNSLGTNTYCLITDGAGNLSWAANGAGGGMSNPMTTLGDLVYENSTPVAARLAGNTNNYKRFLESIGSGGVATAPLWSAFLTDFGNASS